MAEGTRVDKIYSILDYSYRSKHNAGNGFIIIGDAYGFLDPIYSSGVLLALKMAKLAADAIHDAFNHDDFSAAHGSDNTRQNSIAVSSRCASWSTRSTTTVSASQASCVSIRKSASHHQSLNWRRVQGRR